MRDLFMPWGSHVLDWLCCCLGVHSARSNFNRYVEASSELTVSFLAVSNFDFNVALLLILCNIRLPLKCKAPLV